MKPELKLSEKLFCLAINPSKGGILMEAAAALNMTLPGTVLVELIIKGILKVENKKILLVNPSYQNDDIYEFFLNPIRKHGKARRIGSWISWYHMRARKIQKLITRDLVRKNVIRIEERRFLFIPYDKVFLMDRSRIENIRLETENTLLGKTEVAEESIVLAIMADKTNLLGRMLKDKAQRKIAANFIKKLPEMQVSNAVKEALQIVNATVFVPTGG